MMDKNRKMAGTEMLCLIFILLSYSWAGAVDATEGMLDRQAAFEPNTSSEEEKRIGKEIDSLDEATKQVMVKGMLGKLNQSPVYANDQSMGTGFSSETIPGGIHIIRPRVTRNDENGMSSAGFLIQDKGKIGPAIIIARVKADTLFINVGDIIYFNTPASMVLNTDERCVVYKSCAGNRWEGERVPFSWMEKIAKLKIISSNQQISIGRVLAVHDIIHNGETVYFCQKP